MTNSERTVRSPPDFCLDHCQYETGDTLKINGIACDQSTSDYKCDRGNGEIIGTDAELLGA